MAEVLRHTASGQAVPRGLTPKAVRLGLGQRHDNPKRFKDPFDVISPLGQKILAENWHWVAADLQQAKQSKPIVRETSKALARLKEGRRREMTTQIDVCWLRDHFPKLTQDEIASLVDITQSLVSRYAKLQGKQRDHVKNPLRSHHGCCHNGCSIS
ncbi:hypothetical protein [Microvirga sesbaniae]|uniref:hypothetical protein n=1 Tax=Microvirga sesbaniae TaxID=681392 RepID=UPI0021C6D19C|nr:hypothetical protein [Microvirga sp. HBU67692]